MQAALRPVVTLLLAAAGIACDATGPGRVLTVEEVVRRIDDLDGQRARVAGYLSDCGGYDCILYRTEADARAFDRFMTAVRANRRPPPFPDVPMLGIGRGTNADFDAMAAPFRNSYVVITGTVTNQCRFRGEPTCMDRATDLDPVAIRAGSAPARGVGAGR